MQFPITIGLHRSSFLAYGFSVAHLAAAATVFVVPWPLWGRVAAIAALLASMAVSVRFLTLRVSALRLFGDGRLDCRLAGEEEWFSAELLPGATIHHWLTVFRLKCAGRQLAVVILPDSTRAVEFRRLRVWLRWRADFSGAPGGA